MSKRNIMVVDDEPDIRNLVQEILEDEGFEVAVAEDAVRARKLIGTFQPDLILLDIMLPEASGLDLCQMLKNDPRYARIPIVIISAKTQLEDVDRGLQAGAVSYLLKPVAKEELVTTVKSAIASQ